MPTLFFQAEDGIRDVAVTGVQTCALPISVAGFEQYGAKHTELDHLTAHAVDLDPVADAHAVPAHQHEPADEGDDEVLERHGETCAGETEHGAQLPRYSDQHQEDDHHADDLQRDADDVAQRGEL